MICCLHHPTPHTHSLALGLGWEASLSFLPHNLPPRWKISHHRCITVHKMEARQLGRLQLDIRKDSSLPCQMAGLDNLDCV